MAKKKWVQYVMENYTSTNPPKKIFTRTAEEIVDAGRDSRVAPKGLLSWMRMCQFHLNRGGKKLKNQEEIRKAIKLIREELGYS